MSEEQDWEEMLRQFEKALGGCLPAKHRERLNQIRPKVMRIVRAKGGATSLFARHQEGHEEDPLLAFMQKLKDRQGTTMPDFDALYRRKVELDDDPRP